MLHPDCHCKRARHEHGSRATYVVHRCRCDACRDANRVAAKKRTRAKLYGRYNRFIDGDLVRAHIHKLMSHGMGWKRVAKAAGVGASTVYPILYGKHVDQPDHPEHRPPRKQVTREVAERLLAVELDLAGGALVDATGTRRRIQALAARGWPLSRLADRLGMTPANFHLHEDDREQVRLATAEAVKHLYDELWDQEPPVADRWERRGVTIAKRLAATRGWAPPMAWDDDLIDNPEAQPEGHGPRGRIRTDAEEIRWLLDQVDSIEELADILGIQPESARVAISHHGIEVPRRIRVAADMLRIQRITDAHRNRAA